MQRVRLVPAVTIRIVQRSIDVVRAFACSDCDLILVYDFELNRRVLLMVLESAVWMVSSRVSS